MTDQPAVSHEDEKLWAALAHLSVLLNLITGFLGPVVALVIYLAYRDRSRFIAFQAMQSFIFQLVFWVGGGILAGVVWTITGLLSVILIGLCLIPVALVVSILPVFALVYGVVAAIQVYQGDNFRYWLVAEWTESSLR